MATAKSVIFRIYRNWGNSLGYITFDFIYLALGGQKIYLPGYNPGTLQGAGSDDFADATLISGAYGDSDSFDSTTYTVEPGEPNHLDSEPTTQTAWYRWTAPYSGNTCFSTAREDNTSTAGNAIAIYTGNSLGTLSVIYRASQAIDNKTANDFDAVAGQEYRIAVAIDDDGSGGQIPVNWGMFQVYSSDNYYNNCGLYGRRNSGYNWLSTKYACDPDNGGYVDGKDYVQLVLVLKDPVEFDQIHLFNRDQDSAIREMGVWYSEDEVSQTEGEDDSSSIPNEQLFGYSSDIPISAGSEFVINELLENKVSVGIGFGFEASNVFTGTKGTLDASLGLKVSAKGESRDGQLTCGLALGATMSGGNTSKPGELLAGLNLGFQAIGDRPTSAKLKAGLCLECLMKSERIPDNILEFALNMNVSMDGYQESKASLAAGLFLGFQAQGSNGPPPCLAQKFQHIKWF